MASCSHCGALVADSAAFCAQCGTRLPANQPPLPPPLQKPPTATPITPARDATKVGPDTPWGLFFGWVIVLELVSVALTLWLGTAHPATISGVVGYASSGLVIGAVVAVIARLFGARSPRRIALIVWVISIFILFVIPAIERATLQG